MKIPNKPEFIKFYLIIRQILALKGFLIFTKMYYKYLTAKETISSDQRRVIEQAKYTYSYLKKPLKTNNNH